MSEEAERVRKELERAYRALRGMYSAVAKGRVPDSTMLAYHAPTIAASIRYVNEGALDGADYFIGKPVDVLHSALAGKTEAAQNADKEQVVRKPVTIEELEAILNSEDGRQVTINPDGTVSAQNADKSGGE